MKLDPADFTAEIDHPYWPMRPGSRWVYREGSQRVEVTVTDRTRRIMGIEARVVHDVVTEDGELVEDTFDWFAQDEQANLWYLGEETKEFEEGRVVSTKGSWEAGVDGAEGGILLPADPKVGMVYRQEYYEGQAEDAAEVLSLDERLTVPFGSFDHVLMTKDSTPLEPDVVERKFYAKGVGLVLAIQVSGGSGREELVESPRSRVRLVEQRLSLVTLGVSDLARARAFYESMGWTTGAEPEDDVVFFQAGCMIVALWGRGELAEDSAIEDSGGWGGVTLAYNTRSPAEVDSIMAEAEAAGATIARPAGETFWGGYSGVFHDPDGHPWEVAHNPRWTIEDDGSVKLAP